jgi:hypothetical protein
MVFKNLAYDTQDLNLLILALILIAFLVICIQIWTDYDEY